MENSEAEIAKAAVSEPMTMLEPQRVLARADQAEDERRQPEAEGHEADQVNRPGVRIA